MLSSSLRPIRNAPLLLVTLWRLARHMGARFSLVVTEKAGLTWLTEMEDGWGGVDSPRGWRPRSCRPRRAMRSSSGHTPAHASLDEPRQTRSRLSACTATPTSATSFGDPGRFHTLPGESIGPRPLIPNDDKIESIEEARWITAKIPGAQVVELLGRPPLVAVRLGAGIRRGRPVPRLPATRREAEFDRFLATVMFADIVGFHRHRRGPWRPSVGRLLERHHSYARAMIGRYRGVEVDTAGDGFFATFDGPARAVRCAQAIAEAVRRSASRSVRAYTPARC